MSCDTTTSSYRLEACNVSWGKQNVDCITPATGLSGGEYFTMSTPETKYYVWTDEDDLSTDPAPSGYTAIEVDVSSGYTVSDWITAFITAAEATGELFAKASSDGLSVSATSISIGAVLETIADVDTGFTVENHVEGFGGDLGKTKGPIEISFEQNLFDVNTNQTGLSIVDQINQGSSVSASMELLEMTASKWALIVGKGFGDSLTPAGGTEVVGLGQSKDFNSSFDLGGKMILHPVSKASSDLSRDFAFWVTIPAPESINFDGTDTQAMSVVFNALPDENQDEKINICTFGDHTQDLRAS